MRNDKNELPAAFLPDEIEAAVSPMLLQPLSPHVYPQLARYLALLFRWNQKMNLTAIRDPDVLVRLHLAECLRAAQHIPPGVITVLDYGSGAGFPGIPIQIVRAALQVTLAESQRKKASFLREVLRELGLTQAQVHSGRVEEMPATTFFDLVTLRAVDRMDLALRSAIASVHRGEAAREGWCLLLTSRSEFRATTGNDLQTGTILWKHIDPVPGTQQRIIALGSRLS